MFTKTEAQLQIADFFSKLGIRDSSFTEKNFVTANIGEATVGFEYDETEKILSAQALIYRFRKQPQDIVLEAIFKEETEADNGGGQIVFNSENLTLYLQKTFDEKSSDSLFYKQVNLLAKASLIWSSEILTRAVEKARS